MMDPRLWAQFGLAGLTVLACGVLVWRVVSVLLDRRLGPGQADGDSSCPPMSTMACQIDPLHFQHVKETAESIREWDDKINRGDFSCAWRDRDEVRDFLEELRANRTATASLTDSVDALAEELRTTRNGGG